MQNSAAFTWKKKDVCKTVSKHFRIRFRIFWISIISNFPLQFQFPSEPSYFSRFVDMRTLDGVPWKSLGQWWDSEESRVRVGHPSQHTYNLQRFNLGQWLSNTSRTGNTRVDKSLHHGNKWRWLESLAFNCDAINLIDCKFIAAMSLDGITYLNFWVFIETLLKPYPCNPFIRLPGCHYPSFFSTKWYTLLSGKIMDTPPSQAEKCRN